MNNQIIMCPRCGHRMEYEYTMGKTSYEVACPNDGWQMKPLRDRVGLYANKESLMTLASAMRLLLSQKACKDMEKGKQILRKINEVLGLFEDDTNFIDPTIKELYQICTHQI